MIYLPLIFTLYLERLMFASLLLLLGLKPNEHFCHYILDEIILCTTIFLSSYTLLNSLPLSHIMHMHMVSDE